MAQKFEPARKEVLVAEERRLRLDPDRLLAWLPLRPYQHVADIGCGPGYFSLPLAKYLYEGRLYAVDVQEEMLEACRQRLSPLKFTNVEFVRSREDHIPLPEQSLDGALLAFVLHETEDREAFLRMVAQLLRRSAWIAVLEWKKEPMEEGPPLESRLSPQEVQEVMARAGFRSFSQRDLNQQQYLILARK